MRQKIQPEQLGCGKPYFCSYSTVVRTATPEGARFLSQYIRRYRAACLSLYQLVRRLFQNPENHLALYGLFLPSRVPDAVQKTWFWAENVTGHPLDVKGPFDSPGRKWSDPGRPDANPKAWADLNTDSTYALLVVLADPNLAEPSTWPARVWHQMINEYNLTCSGLRPGSLEKIFRSIPKIGARRQIGESVGTVVRSFLSSVDLSRARARERESVLSSLETAYPFFFRELRNYVEDVCYWQAACRYLEEERRLTREELRSKGFEENSIRSVLSSTQRAAMRSVAGRMPSLAQIRQATAEEQQMAAQHAELVERFTAALTREG